MQSRKRDHDDDLHRLGAGLKTARLEPPDELHLTIPHAAHLHQHPPQPVAYAAAPPMGPMAQMPPMPRVGRGPVDGGQQGVRQQFMRQQAVQQQGMQQQNMHALNLAMQDQLSGPVFPNGHVMPGLLSPGPYGLPGESMMFGGAVPFEADQPRPQHVQPRPPPPQQQYYDSAGLLEASYQPYGLAEGFPSTDMFEEIVNDYICSLSTKKRDKALIGERRYHNILQVLREPKCTTIESAQFRFWAKKMFEIGRCRRGRPDVVLHEGKPVAVREQLYRVLTDAHGVCQHGGRDKTSAQVRKHWSWVPKELIARFVRNCPTCSVRRNPMSYDVVAAGSRRPSRAGHATPPSSATSSSPATVGYPSGQPTPVHPLSPADSRRTSMIAPGSGGSSISPVAAGPLGPVVSSMEHAIAPTPTLMTPISVSASEPHLEAARAAFTYAQPPAMISTVPGEADGYADLAPPPHGTGYSADGQLLFSGGPPPRPRRQR